MAVTEAFLATCRTAIERLPELTAFRTAYASYDQSPKSTKAQYWSAVFDNQATGASLHQLLKNQIRGTVTELARQNSVTDLDREEAYRQLSAQYAPKPARPLSNAVESAQLQELLVQEMLS